jgi:hypothetical protein
MVFDKTFYADWGFFDRIEVTSGRKRTGRKRVPPGPHMFFICAWRSFSLRVPGWLAEWFWIPLAL